MKKPIVFVFLLAVLVSLVPSFAVYADDSAATSSQTIKTEPVDTVMQRYKDDLNNLQQKVTEGKITQEEADKMTSAINQEINNLQAIEALTDVQQKRDKLNSDYTAQINQRVQNGTMTQDKANEAIADYTSKINSWDGTDYPVVWGGRQGSDQGKPGGSGNYRSSKRGEAFKDAVVLVLGKKYALLKGNKVQIDSSDASITPVSVSGRTLVPLRFLSETFGADVTWSAADKQVTIKTSDKTAVLSLGSDVMTINGQQVTLDSSLQIKNGRTLIPLRAIVENVLGKKVTYNSGVIYITDNEATLGSDDVNTLNEILN